MKTLRGITGEFFHEKKIYGKVSNIHWSTKILLVISNIRLVRIHAVFFNPNLLKLVRKCVFKRIIFPYSLMTGSDRTDKHETLQHFIRIVDIKLHPIITFF